MIKIKKVMITTCVFLASTTLCPAQTTPKLGVSPVEDVIRAMTLDEKIELLVGSTGKVKSSMMATIGNQGQLVPGAAGQVNGIERLGIPTTVVADGPAGLRIDAKRKDTNKTFYCTHFPVATVMSATWNADLVHSVGTSMGDEVKHYGVDVLLAPATNIMRNPLCGRNFEYYSEDPYLAGKTGAAMVRGIQSQHIGASVKHFAANNKETNRKDSDSRVSERALREIYLKQFEIIVKEAHPYTIMSSYNLINGIHASENKELLTGILRDEWGFDGMVTTDWWTFGEHYRETKAGNDIKMAAGYPERIKEAYEKGFITEAEIRLSARRILNMILKID